MSLGQRVPWQGPPRNDIACSSCPVVGSACRGARDGRGVSAHGGLRSCVEKPGTRRGHAPLEQHWGAHGPCFGPSCAKPHSPQTTRLSSAHVRTPINTARTPPTLLAGDGKTHARRTENSRDASVAYASLCAARGHSHVHLRHVRAHAHIPGNEAADALAKAGALGKLSEARAALLEARSIYDNQATPRPQYASPQDTLSGANEQLRCQHRARWRQSSGRVGKKRFSLRRCAVYPSKVGGRWDLVKGVT
jgi:hypothetical protein